MSDSLPNPAAAAESPVTSSPWLTVAQGATRLHLSERTVYAGVAAGTLRHARVGGRRSLRFKAEWLDAWLEAETTPIEVTRAPLRVAR